MNYGFWIRTTLRRKIYCLHLIYYLNGEELEEDIYIFDRLCKIHDIEYYAYWEPFRRASLLGQLF